MIDPELDLTLQRIIRAPRQRIWDAWTRPEQLAKWWTPSPDRHPSRPTRATPPRRRPGHADERGRGETFIPHMDAVFLVVDANERLVFTNAIDSSWRPAEPAPVPPMTAEITFAEHTDGTEYSVVVRHGNPSDRDRHHELGFYDGWGLGDRRAHRTGGKRSTAMKITITEFMTLDGVTQGPAPNGNACRTPDPRIRTDRPCGSRRLRRGRGSYRLTRELNTSPS